MPFSGPKQLATTIITTTQLHELPMKPFLTPAAWKRSVPKPRVSASQVQYRGQQCIEPVREVLLHQTDPLNGRRVAGSSGLSSSSVRGRCAAGSFTSVLLPLDNGDGDRAVWLGSCTRCVGVGAPYQRALAARKFKSWDHLKCELTLCTR